MTCSLCWRTHDLRPVTFPWGTLRVCPPCRNVLRALANQGRLAGGATA